MNCEIINKNSWQYSVSSNWELHASYSLHITIFDKMMKLVSTDSVARVVVYDLSRLTRKGVSDVISIIGILQKNNCELVSQSEGIRFDSQMGMALAGLLSAFNNIDYQTRRDKQAIGIASAKKKNGGKCGWGGRVKGAGNKKSIEIHKSIKKCLENGMTVRAIAKLLKVSPTTVQKERKTFKTPL